jgi:hypothetical protein
MARARVLMRTLVALFYGNSNQINRDIKELAMQDRCLRDGY